MTLQFAQSEVPVVVSAYLPTHPSEREDMRRWVRQELLRRSPWISMEPGLAPGEPTHAYLSLDPGTMTSTLMVSLEFFERLRDGVTADFEVVDSERTRPAEGR